MTTDTSFDAEVTAKAAESGANASARFRERMAEALEGAIGTEPHRW